MGRLLLIYAMALLASGCHRFPLSCRSESLYPDYLASEHLLTPDPCRRCFYGQQIVMHWDLPRECFARSAPPELVLYLRYGTREHSTYSWTLSRPRGYRIFRLINEEYWCREGILSFKAELRQEGERIAEWTHHLWADLIELHANA